MKHLCYTFGYSGQRLEDLHNFLDESGAVLCDIRYSPLSRLPAWRKPQLLQKLGSSYRHIPELGNLNYKNGGEVEIADLATGLEAVSSLLQHHPVVLMCACRQLESCHRKVVAQALGDMKPGMSIEELEL